MRRPAFCMTRGSGRSAAVGVVAAHVLSGVSCATEPPRVRLVIEADPGLDLVGSGFVDELEVTLGASEGTGTQCWPCTKVINLREDGNQLPQIIDYVLGSSRPYHDVWFVVRARRSGSAAVVQQWSRYVSVPESGVGTTSLVIHESCVHDPPMVCDLALECIPPECLTPDPPRPTLPAPLQGDCPDGSGWLECADPCTRLPDCTAADADADSSGETSGDDAASDEATDVVEAEGDAAGEGADGDVPAEDGEVDG